MTYAEHKVTLTITAERPGNIRNFFFLGFVVAIPDPEDDWSSYVVNDGSNTTSAGSTTSQAQFDQSKKKIIIIAASCGAGAGILLALFLYCCCSCCKDDRNYHKSNKIQKRPKSTYSTAPAPGNGRRLTRSTYSTPAAALNNNINNNNNNSTSANPWSSSMSIRSAAPSIAPTTATSTTAFDTATFTRSSIYATPFEQPAKAKARHESLSSAHSSLYGQGIPPAGTAARYSMRPASSVISHQELPQYQPRLSYQPHSPSLLSSGFGIDSKPPPSSPTAITKTTAQADAKTSPLDSKAPSRLSSAAISYLLYPSPVASLEPPSPKPLNPSRTSSALHPNAAVITPPTAIESSEALE
ncbi:hypothetical protein FRC17_002745 [Serendipita sp. 399]|nr:hypothetical protein FRC17_002745 [Serendipita sp. 399]